VLIVVGLPGRNEDMFNDKTLLLPPLIVGTSELDGLDDLVGGWVVKTPSPVGVDEIVGKSVVDEPVGRSTDKGGRSVVD
jgi:hypothetical protein